MRRARKQLAVCKARQLLKEMEFTSPPVDAFWIAKRKGWQLVWMDLETDGACVKVNDEYFIFINSNESEPRTMFTVAHEIGHIILGHLEVNNPQPCEEKIMDTEANYFAAELLMCSPFIKKAISQHPIDRLANCFGVSKQAMRIRLETLRII